MCVYGGGGGGGGGGSMRGEKTREEEKKIHSAHSAKDWDDIERKEITVLAVGSSFNLYSNNFRPTSIYETK